jgi:integration host factor subunit beta
LTLSAPRCDLDKEFETLADGSLERGAAPGKGRGIMTKSELIDAIAGRGELTKARAELVVNCVFDAMTQALQRGDGIEIRGFGSFTVRPYKPYNGRNPRTGQPVPVPAKRLPFFKVGKELKELVNSSRNTPISGGDDDDNDGDDD